MSTRNSKRKRKRKGRNQTQDRITEHRRNRADGMASVSLHFGRTAANTKPRDRRCCQAPWGIFGCCCSKRNEKEKKPRKNQNETDLQEAAKRKNPRPNHQKTTPDSQDLTNNKAPVLDRSTQSGSDRITEHRRKRRWDGFGLASLRKWGTFGCCCSHLRCSKTKREKPHSNQEETRYSGRGEQISPCMVDVLEAPARPLPKKNDAEVERNQNSGTRLQQKGPI